VWLVVLIAAKTYNKSKLERALGRAHTFAAATFLVPFLDL